MKTTINNELIRSLTPCYDPLKYVTDEVETLPILDWVSKYRGIVPDKDIIWLLCHKEFLSDKELRLFAVWCAREVFKLVDNPDPRSVEACNVAERYTNGEATDKELAAAYWAAYDAYAARNAADAYAADATYAAVATTYAAAYMSAYEAAVSRDTTISASQLDKLLTYFNESQ